MGSTYAGIIKGLAILAWAMLTMIPSRLLTAILLVLITAAEASALTVAVFPLDDLSASYNTINQPMTDILRQEVSGRQGVSVISRERVEAFMSAHRIRRLGIVQGQDLLAARDELQADLVLLASLCQQSDKASTLGMTASLFRTSDGKTIWTSTKGVSLLAEQRLLGIDAPATMSDLKTILVRDLFATFPADLQTLAGRSLPGPQAIATHEAAIEVDSVLFTPKYVRPGQEVKCTIRFKVKKDEGQANVFIRVGNRVHTAKTDDGVYYQVSWVGEEGKTGTPMKVAMNTPEPRIVNGVWSGEPQDASYPVTLILEWASGKREESYLGTYVVDSHPPEVYFKVQAKPLEGLPAFRHELPLSVRFKRTEPIAQWNFAVLSPEGKILLEEKGSEQPPESFLWRGQDAKNQRLDSGVYDLKITVWDRAGNMGRASERVRLLSVKPGLNLAVAREQGQIKATLSAQDQVGISYWRLELWSQDNTMLKAFEGQSLPARINLPDAVGAGSGPTDCIVQVRDVLGMKATKKVPNLLAQLVHKDPGTGGKTSSDPGPDSDDWHPDF